MGAAFVGRKEGNPALTNNSICSIILQQDSRESELLDIIRRREGFVAYNFVRPCKKKYHHQQSDLYEA